MNWYLRKKDAKSLLATRIHHLASPVSDFRILLRYYGLIPLFQWILYSETYPPANAKLKWLTRAQNVVNAIYYPLEHAYWLGLHQVVPMKDSTRDKIGMLSCRAWAAYVILYFLQLAEEYRMLRLREKSLLNKKKTPHSQGSPDQHASEMLTLKEEKSALLMNTLINAAYFPLTIHWSLERSSLPDVGVGIFGTIAAVAQMMTAWKSA